VHFATPRLVIEEAFSLPQAKQATATKQSIIANTRTIA
jgi:hypothetical protein